MSSIPNIQVVVPKSKGEILGVVIVESGWGSMLPTIVLANLSPSGPAARCGQLNIGDQVREREREREREKNCSARALPHLYTPDSGYMERVF